MGWWRRLFGGGDEAALLELRLRMTRWRHFLWTERAFLTVLEDLSEKLLGEFVLDRQFALSAVERAFQEAQRLAYDCGVLRGDESDHTLLRLDDLKRSLTDYLGDWPLSQQGPAVVPLAGDGYRTVEVGEPARDLVLALRRGATSTADGFIITCQGLRDLLAHNGLDHHLRPSLPSQQAAWEAGYRALALAIPRASLPGPLETAVQEALGQVTGEHGPTELVLWPSPMRSESMAEHSSLCTFGDAASLFKAALEIWRRHFAEPEFARLSVRSRSPLLAALVVQRRSPGGQEIRVRTIDPERPDPPTVLLQSLAEGVRTGLWQDLTDETRRLPRKSLGSEADSEESDLIRSTLAIEELTHRAVDAIWKLEESGGHTLLQLRRLDAAGDRTHAKPRPVEDGDAILQGRGHLCGGVASGPIVGAIDATEAAAFPEGGVLVAPRWAACHEAVLPRAAALLLGQPPPYPVITRIRSLRIPTIIGLARAVEISAGTLVTVDAEEERVHRGRQDALSVAHLLSGSLLVDEPEYQALEGVFQRLGHSEGTGCSSRARAREAAPATLLDEVFAIQRRAAAAILDASPPELSRFGTSLHLGARLEVPVCFVDLEPAEPRESGGRHVDRTIDPPQVASAPWAAFWEGLSAGLDQGASSSALPATNRPLIIVSKRSLHLTSTTADSRFLLSARLTGVEALNHLHGCWLRRTPAGQLQLEGEARCFGRSETETAEQLRDLGQRWSRQVFSLDGTSHSTEAGRG